MRTTRKDLNELCSHLRKVTGRDFHIGLAYGKPRLHEGNGSDVSPRLKPGELMLWLSGMAVGFQVAFEETEKKAAAGG